MENKFEILKMSAEWCGPCRATKPVFESFSESNANYICTEVDVDKDGETAQKYHVKNIPTLIFLKNGEFVKRHVGAFTESQLASLASEAFD